MVGIINQRSIVIDLLATYRHKKYHRVAVGIAGTEVTKGASDIILMDDILSALQGGS